MGGPHPDAALLTSARVFPGLRLVSSYLLLVKWGSVNLGSEKGRAFTTFRRFMNCVLGGFMFWKTGSKL